MSFKTDTITYTVTVLLVVGCVAVKSNQDINGPRTAPKASQCK